MKATEHKTFHRQFTNVKKLITQFGVIETVDISPPNAKGNPIVFTSGWCGTIQVSEAVMYEFYRNNRRIVAFNYPTQNIEKYLKNFPSFEHYKAAVLHHVVTYFSLNHFDLVAHSEGTYISLLAMKQILKQVDQIVFINPSVMHARLGLKDLLLRVLLLLIADTKTLFHPHHNESGTYSKIVKNTFKTVLRDPLLTLGGGFTLLRTDIDAFKHILTQINQKITVLHSSTDALFPLKEVTHLSKTYGIKNVITIDDDDAGHLGVAVNPKPYLTHIISILNQKPAL